MFIRIRWNSLSNDGQHYFPNLTLGAEWKQWRGLNMGDQKHVPNFGGTTCLKHLFETEKEDININMHLQDTGYEDAMWKEQT